MLGAHNPFVGCLLALIVNILVLYLVFFLIKKNMVLTFGNNNPSYRLVTCSWMVINYAFFPNPKKK